VGLLPQSRPQFKGVVEKKTRKVYDSVPALLTPGSIKTPLRACGYRPELLKADFPFRDKETIPLVGFAQPPVDSRSACVAVLFPTGVPQLAVDACRPLGAPLVFVCFHDTLQWWKQGPSSAECLEIIAADNVEQFFRHNQNQFSPDVVYRAKTWGRFRTADQLSFVDLGLMPLVEEQVGASLAKLVERNVEEMKDSLGWTDVTEAQGHWLLKTIFWLLSGKILRDKQVGEFQGLDLNDVEEVFRRLATHYGTDAVAAGSKAKLDALRGCAGDIDRFSTLALATTESLAYVYENALISKNTRSSLGTHSTPSYLVDYVVGNLTDWIAEIPIDERSVFEPACGHAAFLVSAMRLLTELLPPDKVTPSRRGKYLRTRLHGTDIDPFALELARLSLTLTDIPNPNGWDLQIEDMFARDVLIEQAKNSTILLANPPFNNFSQREQQTHRDQNSAVRFLGKPGEMLWRTVQQLPEGGVFGVVLPQTILHSDNARDLRKFLLSECELREICLFPDKVFSFSDAESAVLIGRRKRISGTKAVRYRRVREHQLGAFRSNYVASTTRAVPQFRFSSEASSSLRLPELDDVWTFLENNPTLVDLAAVEQGIIYYGQDLRHGATAYSEKEFPGSTQGFPLFGRGLHLHELPQAYWMSTEPSVIRWAGTPPLVGAPQVLLNYAPASRGPWRLKALIDKLGHPATSRFMRIRPTAATYTLETVWALLNSPIANAYVYSHLGKRDNIVGEIRKIPVPKGASFTAVDRAASAYVVAASSQTEPTKLRDLLHQVDCEVLNLYALPFELEQSVLSLFVNEKRLGVPFTQTRYLPKDLEVHMRFSDFVQFERDWSGTNHERGLLIDKAIAGSLSLEERKRLEALQIYAEYHVDQVSPLQTRLLDELEQRLLSRLTTDGTQ
jgi:hypothetical protein